MAKEPLRKEFDVLWRTGLCPDGEEIPETAAVCSLGLDSGDTTLTRTFYKTEEDESRAEDHLLEWLHDQPAFQEANDIHIKLFLNYSPQEATSEGLVMFLHSLKEQEKYVAMTLRFVRLYKCRSEDEAEENKNGLRLLKRSKVTVDVVRECDWLFLMNVLSNRETKREQGRTADKVKLELVKIFQDPKDEETSMDKVETVEVETSMDKVETVEVETSMDKVETADSETMTEEVEEVEEVEEEKEGSSSSDGDE